MTYRAPRAARAAASFPPAPSTIDLHTHTNRSDGVQDPARRSWRPRRPPASATSPSRTTTPSPALRRAGLATRSRPAPASSSSRASRSTRSPTTPTASTRASCTSSATGSTRTTWACTAALDIQRQQRRRRFWLIVERLEELEMPIDDDIVATLPLDDDDALGRPTVARALVAKGYAESVDDAFLRLLARGQPGVRAAPGPRPEGRDRGDHRRRRPRRACPLRRRGRSGRWSCAT